MGLEDTAATALAVRVNLYVAVAGRLSPGQRGRTVSVFLPLSELALRLDSSRYEIHAGTQRRAVGRFTLGRVYYLAEGHDVTAGDPEHGEFRELLIVRVGGNRAPQCVESGAYRVHPRSFPRVRFYSPLAGHVLVVPLLARGRVLPRMTGLGVRRGRRRCRGGHRLGGIATVRTGPMILRTIEQQRRRGERGGGRRRGGGSGRRGGRYVCAFDGVGAGSLVTAVHGRMGGYPGGDLSPEDERQGFLLQSRMRGGEHRGCRYQRQRGILGRRRSNDQWVLGRVEIFRFSPLGARLTILSGLSQSRG